MHFKRLSQLYCELKFINSPGALSSAIRTKFPFYISRNFYNIFKHYRVPPSLQLEPTNNCNLRCTVCSRDTVTRSHGFMSYPLFKNIIDEASKIGVKRIHFYNHGEPFLHPQIIEMITYMKEKGMGLTLSTNGMFLDNQMGEQLLSAGVNTNDYLRFSIYGHSKQVHEGIMRNVCHKTVLSNIDNLIRLREMKKLPGPIYEVIFHRCDENAAEEKQFYSYWKTRVDRTIMAGDISVSYANFKISDVPPARSRTSTCLNLWERMTVLWNGDVVSCISDLDGERIFGNLENETIINVWRSEGLRELKIRHQIKDFKNLQLCEYCDWN